MTRFETLFFDLDGTLIDSAPDLYQACKYALDLQNFTCAPYEILKPVVSFGARAMLEASLDYTHQGLNPNCALSKAHTDFLIYYHKNIFVHSRIFDHVIPTLNTLKAEKRKLIILTNKPYDLAMDLLQKADLLSFFDFVSGSDSTAYKKPDARHLTLSAGSAQAQGPFLMIGDSQVDIQTAKNAAIPSIGVRFGYHNWQQAPLEATQIIACWSAFLETLLTIEQSFALNV